jgi:hypothetical protein
MKWIKTFETFDFSQTLPVASKADLTFYYHCDGCNALWKEMGDINNCKFCDSDKIEELSKDEWYETIGDRLDEDEFDNFESERLKDEEDFIDLYKIKRNNVN